MNTTIEQIYNHRSIRKYQNKEIDDQLLNEILEAGIRASSSGNMQAYSIIVTKDINIREQLLGPHFNQQMVVEAPRLITFCADFNRMRKWLASSSAPLNFDNPMSFMIAAIDAILVSQNVAIAAESYGLGLCYLGTTLASCSEIAKILNCPRFVLPVVGFTLGYPAEQPPLKDRLPLGGLVHKDVYQDYSNQKINEIYLNKEMQSKLRYSNDPIAKNLNLAQIYTQIKYTRESHLEYSQKLLECLKEQGFF